MKDATKSAFVPSEKATVTFWPREHGWIPDSLGSNIWSADVMKAIDYYVSTAMGAAFEGSLEVEVAAHETTVGRTSEVPLLCREKELSKTERAREGTDPCLCLVATANLGRCGAPVRKEDWEKDELEGNEGMVLPVEGEETFATGYGSV